MSEFSEKEVEFLQESNNIEDVWDAPSLIQALRAWDYIRDKKALTIGDILKTHKILMLNQPLRPNEKGYLRYANVWVGDVICPAPELVKPLLSDWVQDVNEAGEISLNEILDLHVRFEKIHPFIDGNGRMGRILMNWQARKQGDSIVFTASGKHKIYYPLFQEEK